ncbi:uncharacterized protein LOC143714392 [Siphateles boraxobius]|uniref:uncharacterized protein LOC143714392 n=1 Tax=Siphateles boraxobius TaxID=180520 RepID=UPI0040645974
MAENYEFYTMNFILYYESSEVEVVPSSWLQNSTCAWPTYKSVAKIQKAVTLQESPNHTWSAFRVRIIHTTDTYQEARHKLPQATLMSDLQTDDDDDRPAYTKRKNSKDDLCMELPCAGIKETTQFSTKEAVWRILGKLLVNSLAKRINWSGANQKVAFRALALRTVVVNAVRTNAHTKTSTDKEVEKYITRWLQLAPDRDGGRKMEKKELNLTTCLMYNLLRTNFLYL